MIYLLHFERPLHHARHYLGWSAGTGEDRIEAHRAGHASKLTAAVVRAGIKIEVGRIWPEGTREQEHRMKAHSERLCFRTSELCYICRYERRESVMITFLHSTDFTLVL